MPGFIRVPYDDIDAIKAVAYKKNQVVAILVEPIQGEGGINVPRDMKDYLSQLRDICDEQDWLLMFDEVQSGIGRTGRWFAHQHAEIIPDVMTLAKGLASGVPIGACVVNNKAASMISPGKHGSTFGGNPLACAAGITTLDAIINEQLMNNAMIQGNKIVSELKKDLGEFKEEVSIRNAGLMIGIELSKPCGELIKLGLDAGLLINVTAEKVIRLLPPLIINDEETSLLISKLSELVKNFLKS